GALALRYFKSDVRVMHKADQTPVTQADQEAETAIVERLRSAFPDIGLLGEEYGAQGSQSRRWIIDPLVGTKNYVPGISIWGSQLGPGENGVVTLGMARSPATDGLDWGRRGRGAWLEDVRLRVSTVDRLRGAMVPHSSLNLLRSPDRGRLWDGFLRLVDRTD